MSYLKQKEAAGVISLQNRCENVFRSTTAKMAEYLRGTVQCLFTNWSKQNFMGIFSQGDRAERGALCFPPLRIQPRSVEKVTLLPIHPNVRI